MTISWQLQTARTVLDRTEVPPQPLTDALRHLRTQIPAVELTVGDDGDLWLLWWPRDGIPSEPVGECFWELLGLVDEPDEDFVRFASRFGPLRWPDGIWDDVGLPTTRADSGLRSAEKSAMPVAPVGIPYSEPIWLWREYALGLRALFATIDAKHYDLASRRRASFDALNVVAVPILLTALGEAGAVPSEEDFVSTVRKLGLSGQDMYPFDQIITAALQGAGVGAAFSSDPKRPHPVYSVSATPLRSSSQIGLDALWQVQGLLPVLATSLALVARNPERSLCTWCGKPARILGRRRRGEENWFGDHAACRAVARSEAVHHAGAKRTEKRRRQSAAKHQGGAASPRKTDVSGVAKPEE